MKIYAALLVLISPASGFLQAPTAFTVKSTRLNDGNSYEADYAKYTTYGNIKPDEPAPKKPINPLKPNQATSTYYTMEPDFKVPKGYRGPDEKNGMTGSYDE